MERGRAGFEAVGIGASAGGVTALLAVIAALPADFAAPVFVVLHLDPRHHSLLPDLLRRRAAVRVQEAVNDEVVRPGVVYIAPPDKHLLAAHGRISLTSSELVHFSRPSIDLLLESVAGTYGPRAIGVVLTGTGMDGATGIRAVKDRGGTTIVQDPEDAEHGGMPRAALATGCVDFKLRLEDVGPALARLVSRAKAEAEADPAP